MIIVLLVKFILYLSLSKTCSLALLKPRDILCGAADEVLIILKNERMKDRERKRETESLLGSLPDERFAQLVNLGKKLTDWSNEQQTQNQGDREAADEEMDDGVPVMIGDDDEDEDEENEIREIDENDDDDDEDNADQEQSANDQGVIKGKVLQTRLSHVF